MKTQTASRTPRRVLMTVDPIGGVWTYALELARALEVHGVEIALASMGTHLTSEQYQEVLARKNVRLFESAFRLEWMPDPWDDVDRAGDWLLKIAERFQPDLVHLNGYSHASLGWDAPVLIGAHSCVLSWWRAVKNEEAPARYNEYRTRVAAGLAAADLVVAPSVAMRDALALHYDGHCNCIVIRNGRDPRCFVVNEKVSLVFSCGRIWDEAKNLRVVDQVAPHIPWPIAVAGDCQHPGGSRVALQNVRCFGKLEPHDVERQLSHAAIFVLPARYEPFGLSALEAGLSGCALVLGDIPSLRETWQGAAIFVPPDDPVALTNALNGLIENKLRREHFGQRARVRALEFSPHRMATEYIAAYRTCAGQQSCSAAERPQLFVEEVAA
jgi:glycosyltransferase involved in cell wall biosynthesis